MHANFSSLGHIHLRDRRHDTVALSSIPSSGTHAPLVLAAAVVGCRGLAPGALATLPGSPGNTPAPRPHAQLPPLNILQGQGWVRRLENLCWSPWDLRLVSRKQEFNGKMHVLLLRVLKHKVYTVSDTHSAAQEVSMHNTFFGTLKWKKKQEAQ